jgi:hypothetical protein
MLPPAICIFAFRHNQSPFTQYRKRQASRNMRRNSEPFKLLSGVVSDPGRKFPHNAEVKEDLLSQKRQSRHHSEQFFRL